jgi:hypothetical protein
MDPDSKRDGFIVEIEHIDSQYDWFEKYLGIRRDLNGNPTFKWRHADYPERTGNTRWDVFSRGNDLREQPWRTDFDWVRFGWIVDPEGNRFDFEDSP